MNTQTQINKTNSIISKKNQSLHDKLVEFVRLKGKAVVPMKTTYSDGGKLAAFSFCQWMVMSFIIHYYYNLVTDPYSQINVELTKTMNPKRLANTQNDYLYMSLPAIIHLVLSIITYYFSYIRKSLGDCHNISQLKSDFQTAKKHVPELSLKIVCSHIKGKGKHKQRVFTHESSTMVKLQECFDVTNGLIPEVEKMFKKSTIFIQFKPVYTFIDPEQSYVFETMQKYFFYENKKDQKQKFTKAFKYNPTEFESNRAYLKQSNFPVLKIIFFICCLTGFAWPLVSLLESSCTQRYIIQIEKKIKLDQGKKEYKEALENNKRYSDVSETIVAKEETDDD